MYFELDVVMVMIRENTFFYMQMVYSLSFVRIVHWSLGDLIIVPMTMVTFSKLR